METVVDLASGDTWAISMDTPALAGPEPDERDAIEWVVRHNEGHLCIDLDDPRIIEKATKLGSFRSGSIVWVLDEDTGAYWLSKKG